MKARRIGKVESGQDVAIFGDYMFDFVAHGVCLGECSVYKIGSIETRDASEAVPICRFILDKTDVIIPHCNTACFGTEYYEDGDEFPLLYLNVYNTYQKCEIRYEGVCYDPTLYLNTQVANKPKEKDSDKKDKES